MNLSSLILIFTEIIHCPLIVNSIKEKCLNTGVWTNRTAVWIKSHAYRLIDMRRDRLSLNRDSVQQCNSVIGGF